MKEFLVTVELFHFLGTPSVIVLKVDKKAWRSGRVADCNPVWRRFGPRMLHAFQTFQLRRTSSILVKNVGEVRYF